MKINSNELKTLLISILNEIYPVPFTLHRAKVVKSYSAGSNYYCDINILKADGGVDTDYPLISKVSIPSLIGGDSRGIIAPPKVGAICDVIFYNGDINYPTISNFRSSKTPKANIGDMLIQNDEDIYIKLTKDGEIKVKGKKVSVDCDNAEVKAQSVLIDSSKIDLGGSGGLPLVTSDCPCQFTGSPHAKFTLKVKGV